MRFTKMQGLGNDYIYLDCTNQIPAAPETLARALSDRNFGIGGDGLILILPSQHADFRMQMFNADGSEGAMCGNGIRCVGKYVYEHGMTDKTSLTIETASGVKHLSFTAVGGLVSTVTVDIGVATIGQGKEVFFGGQNHYFTSVNIGNPHMVSILPNIEHTPVVPIGRRLQWDPQFSGGVNVEFLQIESLNRGKLRVFERGSGETKACGTGACASFAVAQSLGLLSDSAELQLPGGVLFLELGADNHIFLTGDAVTVFEGEISLFQ